MNNVRKQKRANKSLPFFFKDEFKVSFIIIFISTILLITTFSFDIVPPILNRGIQPATFPKALLVLIISLTLIIYYLSTKKPWKVGKNYQKPFI
jgi:hydrogenase-4 membrane subunit HyfE